MIYADLLHRQRRSVLLGAVALVVAGTFAALRLPVTLFPHVNFPRIAVSVDTGDRDAERMLTDTTIPVEEAIRSVPGVRSMRSRTSRGSAEVSVAFDWGHDMVVALLQVQAAIAERSSLLPPGSTFTARRMDPTVFPTLGYSLTSDSHSLVELRDIASLRLRPAILPVEGVARVDVQGGAQEEIHVTADADALAAHGLTMQSLADALGNANVTTATGRLEDHFRLYLVVADSGFRDAADIENLVIRAPAGALLRLRDVATIERAAVPQWTRVTADSHDAVLLQVFQQPDGNTVRVAADIAKTLKTLSLPAGVTIANWYDQSELISASAASLRDALIIGGLLASLVLLVFLRSVKITLIALLTVPGVLAATCLLLLVLKQSLNIMTLGGMAAAVGLIIDDAVVMVEHIVRRVRASPQHGAMAALPAAAEFTRPLIGASAVTIVIHIPPAFLSGVTGEFFKALSLTIGASLVVSFFVAWMATPLLARRLLSPRDAARPDGGPIFESFRHAYEATLTFILRRPWTAALPALALVIAGWLAYPRLASGFMPKMDEGGFVLDYIAKPGASLAETDRLLRQVESILRATPEVQTYSRRTGLQLGGGLTEANEGDFFVRLKHGPRRHIEDIMDDVRSRVESTIPGLEIELIQLMEDLIGDLTAVPQPVEIKLQCDDQAALFEAAPRVAEAIGRIPGVVDVKDGRSLAGDALEVRVDPARAAAEGLDSAAIAAAVTQAFSGTVATQFQVFGDTPKVIGVRVWTAARTRAIEEDLSSLRIAAPEGRMLPLSRVATIERVVGQPQIVREDLRRIVAVTARISGADLGSTIRLVKETLAAPDLLNPPGKTAAAIAYTLGGLYQQQREAFSDLLRVFGAAVALVFLLLVAWGRSVRVAACLVLASLLALPGVAACLWLANTELNISSMMGLAMIVGSVAEAGVLLCAEYLTPIAHGLGEQERRPMDALVSAAARRLRPILMTTLAATLALAPLVFGLGEGAAMLRPLATVITCGLVMQLPLVLVVLPAMLLIARAPGIKVTARLRPRASRGSRPAAAQAAPPRSRPRCTTSWPA